MKETESLLWDYIHHDYIHMNFTKKFGSYYEWQCLYKNPLTKKKVFYNQQKNIFQHIKYDWMRLMKKIFQNLFNFGKKKGKIFFKREINQGGVVQWYFAIGR